MTEEKKKRTIFLMPDAALKLKYYIDGFTDEISGLGKSHTDEDNNIFITDLILLEQECTSATTSLKQDAQAKFLKELQDKKEDPSKWNVWWHSHANFSTFWSSTDTGTIESHIGAIPYLVSIVGNKQGDILGRLDIFPKDVSPFKKRFIDTEDELPVVRVMPRESQRQIEELNKMIIDIKAEIELISEAENKELKEQCEKEIEEKVNIERPKYKSDHVTYYGKDGYWVRGKFIRYGAKNDWYSVSDIMEGLKHEFNQVTMHESLPDNVYDSNPDSLSNRFEFNVFLDFMFDQAEHIYKEAELLEFNTEYKEDLALETTGSLLSGWPEKHYRK